MNPERGGVIRDTEAGPEERSTQERLAPGLRVFMGTAGPAFEVTLGGLTPSALLPCTSDFSPTEPETRF